MPDCDGALEDGDGVGVAIEPAVDGSSQWQTNSIKVIILVPCTSSFSRCLGAEKDAEEWSTG